MSLFTEFSSTHLNGGDTLLGLSGDAGRDFNVLVIEVGAHAVACLQSIHALADILSHAIYFSLGMNFLPGALKDRQINITTVNGLLKTTSGLSSTAHAIDSLLGSSEYDYVAAAANVSKHRSVVSPSFSEDWMGPNTKVHEVKFTSFTYSGKNYPSRSMEEAIKPTYDGFSKLIVDAGNQINMHLAELP